MKKKTFNDKFYDSLIDQIFIDFYDEKHPKKHEKIADFLTTSSELIKKIREICDKDPECFQDMIYFLDYVELYH